MQEDEKIEEYVILDDFNDRGKGSWKEKLKDFIDGKYFIPIVIILIAIISFSLGRISGIQEKRPPVRIISDNSPLVPLLQQGRVTEKTDSISASANTLQNTASVVSSTEAGQVVASKSGAKYHYPWCSGAKQISEKNKITFNSIEEARAAGYTPASNCKGLK